MLQKFKSKWNFLLISIGIVISSLALSYHYIRCIDDLLYRQNAESINEITAQGAKRLEDVLKNNVSMLERKARYLKNTADLGREEKQNLYRHVLETSEQDDSFSVSLISFDGSAADASGKVVRIAEEPYFSSVLRDKKTCISDPFYDAVSAKNIVAIYAPVEQNGQVGAVLRAEISLSDLQNILNISFFGDEGYSYILNASGDVLVGSAHPESNKTFQNLFVFMDANGNNDPCLIRTKEDFQAGRSGARILNSDGTNKFFSYVPLRNASDWYLVTVVKESAITKNTRVVVMYSIAMCVILTLVSLGIFISAIWKAQRGRVRRLEATAYKDPLTGLYNRNYLYKKSNAILRLAKMKRMASVVLDVDKFKMINESFGYLYGDALLNYVARTLKRFMRDHESAIRLKDDLFILILCYDDESDLEPRIHQMFDDIRSGLAENRLDQSNVKFSCGVYLLTETHATAANLFDYADIARKSVKDYAETKIAFFKKSMLQKLQEEKEMEDRMEYALETGEFTVFLQPKVDMATGRLRGAEALVRWSNPEKGIMVPIHFIPLFEKNGFITKLDYYILERICELKRSWRKRGMQDYMISVNMSRNHLRHDDFIATLVEIAGRYEIARETLEIEITESAFFEDTERLVEVMLKLKQAGFKLSMDDFGAGYSSLNLLKKLPIDILKIDKEFLDENEVTPKGRIIMSSIVKMARDIHVEVICEGVETPKQVDFLLEIGCRYGQGYLYAKPMGIQEFEAFVEKIG